jgi:hypothetical protein
LRIIDQQLFNIIVPTRLEVLQKLSGPAWAVQSFYPHLIEEVSNCEEIWASSKEKIMQI